MSSILCSISTRGRYHTSLPLAILSVINQTKKVDKLIIFDDNDTPEDMRENNVYQNLFHMMNFKGIEWQWVFAEKKGQHFNHQLANSQGFEWVWRIDDDTIADPNVLETLYSYIDPSVGAVGGSIITPPVQQKPFEISGRIQNIVNEPSIQWFMIDRPQEVEHLHCSFLYRAGIHDYNLGLSRVAHREETLFTFGLKLKGYKLLVVPNAITWHLKSPNGGIREGTQRELFEHDDLIFFNTLSYTGKNVVVLDNGRGDHIIFKHVLPEIQDPIIFSCYNDIIPGRSIQEAKALFGDINQYNIYRKMDQWHWKDSIENAFRKLYLNK